MPFALDDLVYVYGGKHKGRVGLFKGSKEDAHLLQFFNCKAVVYKGYVRPADEKQKAAYLKRATNSAIVPRQSAPFEGEEETGNGFH